MRYTPIDQELYIHNRKQFTKHLKSGAVAIFNSNDIMPTNADGTMPFRQNNDLLHLCGVDQEESVLLLFPDASNPAHREILFVRETNPQIAVWEGAKLTKEQATEQSGIKNVIWTNDLEKTIKSIVPETTCIYLNSNEHLRHGNVVETRDDRFRKYITELFPLHTIERSAPIMHQIRAVKHPLELDAMRTACGITAKAVDRVLNFVRPGVWEHEIEAEIIHEFVRNRSRGFAYTPIIAGGGNACVLHYIENNCQCQDGDLLLMDIGAEYGNYASDLTRTIPINGRFSARQREVYNAVLRVMKTATTLLRPGVLMADYHKQVGELMTKELVDLALISMDDVRNQDSAWPAYKKYFMHGTSHFIGLDVHDVGLWHKPIEVGNVFTVEPGIYIPEENIGIRLENDIIVTQNGFEDMMADIPLEIEAIEDIMNQADSLK